MYKIVFSIATVMALRMIGLFMIMPLLALYTLNLEGATPFLLGVTLGIYGLTQAFFQVPFGIISDLKGRKTIIVVGLSLFVLGSLIAASAQGIFTMMIGRALQGSGAIGGSLMALLSDLTDEAYRVRAMAILGAVIGVSFSFSLVLGPVLNAWLSVPGIFLLCAVMGIIAIMVLLLAVPASVPSSSSHWQRGGKANSYKLLSRFRSLIRQKKILPLIASSMMLHMILILSFIGVPISLKEYGHMVQNQQWQIYLPVLLLSFIVAFIWIVVVEKKKYLTISMVLSIASIAISQMVLAFFHFDLWSITIGLFIFFVGFNVLEAVLPAQLSKHVDALERGTVMGLYSTAQFVGIFLGGILGGIIYGSFSLTYLFIFAAVTASIWLLLFQTSGACFLTAISGETKNLPRVKGDPFS